MLSIEERVRKSGEIDRKYGWIADNLEVTSFNTIKGKYFKEITIDKFLKMLEKKINKYSKYCYREDMDMDICYEANVYKLDDNNYRISMLSDYNDKKCDYTDYYVNISDFPHYAKVFDKFCEVTNRNEFEKKCYRKIENNEIGTTEENALYLEYLKKLRKCTDFHSLKQIFSLFAFPAAFCGLVLSAYYSVPIGVAIFTALNAHAAINLTRSHILFDSVFRDEDGQFNTYKDSMITSMKKRKMLKRRIKMVLKKLNNKQDIYYGNNKILNGEDLYRDAVINYMNSIMNAAKKLNPDDSKMVLSELKTILEDYTDKCKDINDGDGLGLSLGGNKRQIMADTIEKLTALEMNIADMIKRDNKNNALFSENDKLMQEIDSNIKNIEEGKKLTLARGK